MSDEREEKAWARLKAVLEQQPHEGLLDDLAYLRAVSDGLKHEQREREELEQVRRFQREIFGGVDFVDED